MARVLQLVAEVDVADAKGKTPDAEGEVEDVEHVKPFGKVKAGSSPARRNAMRRRWGAYMDFIGAAARWVARGSQSGEAARRHEDDSPALCDRYINNYP
jgi:hypothetical protein